MFFVLACIAFCADPCTTEECNRNSLATDGIERGNRIKVTCQISDLNGTFNLYSRWYPAADELSLLEIPDPNCTIRNLTENATITLITESSRSIPHVLRKGDFSVEYLSALIHLDNGNMTGIGWDTSFDSNSCKDRRVENDDTCYFSNPATAACSGNSYKIFLGFYGSDSKGLPLTSAESMPSTFLKFGVGGVIDDAADFVKDVINWFK
ncbi:hypothetical protein GPJ56_000035 [Histomonas meleagridis]|uniref:uncharacterized protein n=1 Tax=Histomonas meleagridis TaxID=135588 RepID=UPI0035595D9C|nr:hypothetical protein GPJ56_000035 [Histomonas meleagridis]KAH0805533.1 hypothetical protein GO595_001588 [Histomonas meleagridis]